MLTDYPELPAELDRKRNGIAAEPSPARRGGGARGPRIRKIPEGAVRVYFPKAYKGAAFGYNWVLPLEIGRKKVRVQVGAKRFSIPRKAWEILTRPRPAPAKPETKEAAAD